MSIPLAPVEQHVQHVVQAHAPAATTAHGVVVIRDPRAMRAVSRALRAAGRSVGFAPTMGALHAGHISLVDRLDTDIKVVSIFVNPLQFGPNEDFDAYPRTFDDDVEKCAAAGVHIVFAPEKAALYPDGFETTLKAGPLAARYCGASRPVFFDGIVTVVYLLFAVVEPDEAAFGEKDFQQLAIIRRMAKDMWLAVRVRGVPIKREPDGLAMSSRNRYLDAESRPHALCLSRALRAVRTAAAAGETDAAALNALARATLEAADGFEVDYAELACPSTLEPVQALDRPARLMLAGWLGETRIRLIDNGEVVPA